MHGVTAKIAQEIGVFFEHHNIDAGARQQIAEHDAGRPAAHHTARCPKRFHIASSYR
jgi:hypothetical protein